jgi:cyclic beta-1,2-glucan synthetase
MTLKYRGATYEISVANPRGASRGISAVEMDGELQPVEDGKARLRLRDDGKTHVIRLTIG